MPTPERKYFDLKKKPSESERKRNSLARASLTKDQHEEVIRREMEERAKEEARINFQAKKRALQEDPDMPDDAERLIEKFISRQVKETVEDEMVDHKK